MRVPKADEDDGDGGEAMEEDGKTSEDSEAEAVPRKRKKKARREKMPRSKEWDDKSIRILIEEYGTRFAKTEEISERETEENRRVWKEITKKLRKSGYSMSVKNARRKWDALESVYVDMASHNVHPGLKRITCPYGRELTAILNPGGMRNYLQVEEEEQKEMEKAAKEKKKAEEEAARPVTSVAVGCIVRNMSRRTPDSGPSTSLGKRNLMPSLESESLVITLSSDDEEEMPKAKSPSSDLPSSMKPNVMIQKSANYVEVAQSEPISRPVQAFPPFPPGSDDMVLSIACQMYRHFAHHHHKHREGFRGGPGQRSNPDGEDCSSMWHHNAIILAPLQMVIEKLMLDKERRLTLMEERNDIDRQRIVMEQMRIQLLEQILTLANNQNT
ncbi:uncharacterized protein [Hetaerina americana]|uniref:uncharacterized protein n=1 Tax=Hetaerina americana TaxID=62018 RepID=UPI003A7F4733